MNCNSNTNKDTKSSPESKYEGFEWMKNIDPKMIELIENEVSNLLYYYEPLQPLL